MEQLYLGRIVAFAVTPSGAPAALYRVSSRSFPNRLAAPAGDGRSVAIVPKPGHEADIQKNPYIAYNAARLVGDYAVLANGSHTDPISEKLAMGYPVRDALALSLLALDYEKDAYNTPRIVVVADARTRQGYLGTVRHDGLDVRAFTLRPGQVVHLSTYEHAIPSLHYLGDYMADTAAGACEYILGEGEFESYANPVTAVAAVAKEGAFQLAAKEWEVR